MFSSVDNPADQWIILGPVVVMGKVAVVSGASYGIGEQIAKQLAAKVWEGPLKLIYVYNGILEK